jgi:hypothetical protein
MSQTYDSRRALYQKRHPRELGLRRILVAPLCYPGEDSFIFAGATCKTWACGRYRFTAGGGSTPCLQGVVPPSAAKRYLTQPCSVPLWIGDVVLNLSSMLVEIKASPPPSLV